MSTASRLATAMRYRDVPSAADWLCGAFGFEKQTVAVGETGTVHYAQLTFGTGMLMLAPVRETTADRFMKQPDEIGGAETQSCYFVVADADAHYARAKAAGAEIILELQEDDFGGRGYSCRDPEGHIWSFGTHDPWQGKQPPGGEQLGRRAGARAKRWLVAAGLAIVIASGAAWMGGALRQPSAVSSTARHVHDQAAGERAAAETEQLGREVAERAAREAREELDRERAAKVAAERAVEEVQKRAAVAQQAKEVAERAAWDVAEQLDRERAAKTAVERANEDAQKRVAEERDARQAAERAAKVAAGALEQAQKRVAEEQSAKNAVEHAAKVAAGALEQARKRIADEQRARETAESTARTLAEQAGKDPDQRVAEERSAREVAERAAADAARALEQAQKRVAEAQSAREAAERTAKEAREQLVREQALKNAAWGINAQLRRQLSQSQSANQPSQASEFSLDNPSPPATKAAKVRPKWQKKGADADD